MGYTRRSKKQEEDSYSILRSAQCAPVTMNRPNRSSETCLGSKVRAGVCMSLVASASVQKLSALALLSPPRRQHTMASSVEISLPLPVLPTGWAGEKDFKPVGQLAAATDRNIEPVGPHFLAYARRVRHLQTYNHTITDTQCRSDTSAPSPRMSASRPRPTSSRSRTRTRMTLTSQKTPSCCSARPRTGRYGQPLQLHCTSQSNSHSRKITMLSSA
jgi:hypothetical protein